MNSNLRNLTKEHWVPIRRGEVFAFFSDPQNLSKITPPAVGFKILTPSPIVMDSGTLIDYQVRIHGIPFRWRSLISDWNPPCSFTDVQLKGPYATWRHEHIFTESDGGTLITDQIQYSVPMNWMPGVGLVERFFVRPELERIFAHRRTALEAEFGFSAKGEKPPTRES